MNIKNMFLKQMFFFGTLQMLAALTPALSQEGQLSEVIDQSRDLSQLDPFDPAPPQLSDADYELLDFALYGRAFDPTTLPEYLEIIEPRLKELEKKLPNVAAFLRYLFNEGGASWFFVKDPVAKTAVAAQVTSAKAQRTDTALVLTYQRVQAAVTYPDAFVTLINHSIWEKLKNEKVGKTDVSSTEAVEARAFLLLHELLWMAELSPLAYQYFNTSLSADQLEEVLPKTTAEKIRTLTGLLLSKSFVRKDKFTIAESIKVNTAQLKETYSWYENRGKEVVQSLPADVFFEIQKTKLSPLALLAVLDEGGVGALSVVQATDIILEKVDFCLARVGYTNDLWSTLKLEIKNPLEVHALLIKRQLKQELPKPQAGPGFKLTYLQMKLQPTGSDCEVWSEQTYVRVGSTLTALEKKTKSGSLFFTQKKNGPEFDEYFPLAESFRGRGCFILKDTLGEGGREETKMGDKLAALNRVSITLSTHYPLPQETDEMIRHVPIVIHLLSEKSPSAPLNLEQYGDFSVESGWKWNLDYTKFSREFTLCALDPGAKRIFRQLSGYEDSNWASLGRSSRGNYYQLQAQMSPIVSFEDLFPVVENKSLGEQGIRFRLHRNTKLFSEPGSEQSVDLFFLNLKKIYPLRR